MFETGRERGIGHGGSKAATFCTPVTRLAGFTVCISILRCLRVKVFEIKYAPLGCFFIHRNKKNKAILFADNGFGYLILFVGDNHKYFDLAS
jgi:hypothetical protein